MNMKEYTSPEIEIKKLSGIDVITQSDLLDDDETGIMGIDADE